MEQTQPTKPSEIYKILHGEPTDPDDMMEPANFLRYTEFFEEWPKYAKATLENRLKCISEKIEGLSLKNSKMRSGGTSYRERQALLDKIESLKRMKLQQNILAKKCASKSIVWFSVESFPLISSFGEQRFTDLFYPFFL